MCRGGRGGRHGCSAHGIRANVRYADPGRGGSTQAAGGRVCRARVMEGTTVGRSVLSRSGLSQGYTCVPLGGGHEGRPLALSLLLSFLNFREETRTKQAMGPPPLSSCRGTHVYPCVGTKSDRPSKPDRPSHEHSKWLPAHVRARASTHSRLPVCARASLRASLRASRPLSRTPLDPAPPPSNAVGGHRHIPGTHVRTHAPHPRSAHTLRTHPSFGVEVARHRRPEAGRVTINFLYITKLI